MMTKKVIKMQRDNVNKAANGISNLRTSVLMYEQQIDKLPLTNLNAIETRAKSLKKNHHLKHYAYIVHDKDVDEEGNLVKKHVHMVLIFNQRVSVQSIAKAFDDNVQQFEVMTKRGNSAKTGENNSLMYLIHRTANSVSKYQYSPEDVKSDFNFIKFVAKKETEFDPKDILDRLAEGLIDATRAKKEIMVKGATVYAKFAKKISDVSNAYLEIEYEEWLKQMKRRNGAVKIVWLYGAGGTGKTRYAVDFSEERHFKYFKTKGSNDPFEGYQGQKVLIIDELRPNTLKYQDLLQILDPRNYDKKTVARYHNAFLMAEIIFITSPFNPYLLYKSMHGIRRVDTFDQLNRRIGLTLEFTHEDITEVECYCSKSGTYKYKEKKHYQNKYSGDKVDDSFNFDDLESIKKDCLITSDGD